MKKGIIVIIVLFILALIGLGIYLFLNKKDLIDTVQFKAKIVDVSEKTILVDVLETTEGFVEGSPVSVHLPEINNYLEKGHEVNITFNGVVMESYPPQINATKVEVIE